MKIKAMGTFRNLDRCVFCGFQAASLLAHVLVEDQGEIKASFGELKTSSKCLSSQMSTGMKFVTSV